jgi:hypothetical protein
MFENHMLQMFDTREIELRRGLSERRVDLVPPFRRTGTGVLGRLVEAVRSFISHSRTRRVPTSVPAVPRA